MRFVKILILISSVLWIFNSHAQNLIMNPEFQQVNYCHEYNSPCAPADWISTCDFNPEYRGESNRYVKLIAFNSSKKNVRDYIQTQLLCDMVKGEEYEITIAIKQSECLVSSLGILFSDQIYYRKTNELIDVVPSIDFTEQLEEKGKKVQKEWVMLTTTYTANGTEKFMLIGNFQTDKDQKREFVLEEKQFTTYKYSLDLIYVNRVNEDELCDLADSVRNHWDEYTYRHTPIKLMPYIPGEQTSDTISEEIIEEEIIVEETPRIDTITLSDVIFDFNSDVLTDDALITIDGKFEQISIDEVDQIIITGHTDNIGKPDYNIDLSLRRSESVKSYLTSLGYYENLIITIGKGDEFPIEDNSTEEGRKANRRIEIKIIYR